MKKSFQDGPSSSRCCCFFRRSDFVVLLYCCPATASPSCTHVLRRYNRRYAPHFCDFFCCCGNSTGPAILFFSSGSSPKPLWCCCSALPFCDTRAVLSLSVDASDSHVGVGGGGVLQQKVGRGCQPLAFVPPQHPSPRYQSFQEVSLLQFLRGQKMGAFASPL